MKEHKSNMSMVARFAYIFATIVTIFAQMGAAVPAMIADADTLPTGFVSTAGMTMSKPSINGNLYTVDIGGTEPDNGKSFKVNMLGTGLVLNDTETDRANGSGTSGSTYYTIRTFSGWRVVNNGDNTLTVTRDDDYINATTSGLDSFDKVDTSVPWPMHITFLLNKDNPLGGAQLDGSDPIIVGETNSLTLNVLNNGPTTYKVGDEVDLQVSDQKMISGGEVDVAKNDVSQYLKFNYDKTVALLKKQGYTQSSATADGISQYADDAATASQVSKFTDADDNYFYLVNANGDGRIVWPQSDGKSQRTAIVAMDAVGTTSDVSLTSTYLSGSLKDKLSNSLDLKIEQGEVDATTLRMVSKYVVPAISGSTTAAKLTSFPYFYMKDTDSSGNPLISVVYNQKAWSIGGTGNSINVLRQGLNAGTAYTDIGSALKSSTAAGDGYFENFHQINADGSIKAGTEKKLSSGKTYTLFPDNPLTTGSNRFPRVNDTVASKNYYMPDGVPTFKVDNSGNITLVDNGDGNAIKNQWTASGNTITVKVYHLKQVQVVDDQGNPVSAKLKLKNTTAGESTYMQADTSVKGSTGVAGELLPSDFDTSKNGPFYYADGVQAFDSLTIDPKIAAQYDTSGIKFSSLTIDPLTDQLVLSKDATNAVLTDSSFDTYATKNQVLKLTVHKYTDADKKVTIKKVDQADNTKALGGATFKITEPGNTTSSALNTTTSATDSTTGLASVTADPTGTSKTRVFKVTEDAVPAGYEKGNADGYFATWEIGKGFTGVGSTANTATAQTSPDGLAKVVNGQLQIADPAQYSQGGSDSQMRIQYVDAARFLDSTNQAGTTISGAQLPVLQENFTYPGTGLEGFSGLGGVIYNPDHKASDFMKPDSGITTATLQNDGSMATSSEKSGNDGLGYIQGLWSQTGVVHGWEGLTQSTNGWILRNAIVNGGIPKTNPLITYQLITDAQKQRAVATPASGYYALGSTLVITGDGKTITVENPNSTNKATKYNTAYRDNPVEKPNGTNTAKVELYKVKHVRVVDSAGNKIPNVKVNFTKMTAATGDDGSDGELMPTNGTFVFPDGSQKLTGVTTSDGKALLGVDGASLDSSNGAAFEFQTGGTDKLVVSGGKDVSMSDDGQTVIIKVQSPTTIKIHKQSKTNAATSVAGAKFQVWTTDGGSAKAVTTPNATDDNGNTSVTLTNPDSKGSYHIKEVANPSGYAPDSNEYNFTASAKGVVSATDDKTKTVSVASDGTLNFADMPDGSGGVGDNGSNGGTLTINKVNADTTSADTPPDGAQFTVKEITAGATGTLASGTDITTTNGKATLDLGSPTTATRLFTITEKTAPTGYVKNTNTYTLKIDPTGIMSLGQGTDASKITNTTETDDGAIKFVSTTNHAMNFADSKRTITIHKQDFANASTSLQGATFTIAPNDDATATATGTTDASGNTTITLKKVDSNNKYIVTETTAPDKYVAASPVTLDADGKLATTSDSKATSIDKNVLTVKDVKKGSGGVGDNGTNGGTLTINKIDRATGTSLAGATFKVKEQLTGNYEGSSTTDSTGNATFNLGDPTTSDRMFTIYEDTAPSGYIANTNYYYLRITATGAMYFGDPNASGTPSLPTQTTDGNLKFTSTTDHTIKFADQSASQPIKVTKTNASGTALQGATFQLSESDINGKLLTKGYSISQTTPTNGTVQFTPSVTDTAVHYYLLQETAAPTQYATGASEVVVYQGGKVTGVKTLAGSSVEGSAGPLTKNADSTLTYVDQYKPMPNRTINVRRAITDGDTPSLSIVNKAFKVTLQSVSDPTKVYPIDIDATSGEGKVTATALATAMGYSSAPDPTKTDTFWLSIDPEQSNYSVPVKRQVTFSWDREKGGFKVISTQNDNMIDDDSQDGAGQPNVKNKVGTGNLRMYLRRDTLVAQQDVADVNQEQPLVPNAQFTLNYISNGTQIATQNVKTNDFGVVVLQAPTAKDMTSADNTVFPVNQTVDVQLTQTNGTKIPGYQNFTKTAYLKYNSATGFTVPLTNATTGATQLEIGAKVEAQFDPNSGDEDPTTVPVSPDPDTGLNVYAGLVYKDASSDVVGTQYAYAGTQLLVPLTQATTAALTDAPQVMNFGKAQLSANDQTLSLIPSNDTTNAAAFDTSTLNEDAVADGTATDDQDTSGNATGFLNASVTQSGTLTGGWRLDMSMSDLTAQGGTDTVKTGSVSMAAPAVTLTPSSETDPDTKGMGIEAPTVKMNSMATAQSVANTGSNSAPGVYNIAWDMSGVKMHLPALSGKMNTNYHSTISWDLITAP